MGDWREQRASRIRFGRPWAAGGERTGGSGRAASVDALLLKLTANRYQLIASHPVVGRRDRQLEVVLGYAALLHVEGGVDAVDAVGQDDAAGAHRVDLRVVDDGRDFAMGAQ